MGVYSPWHIQEEQEDDQESDVPIFASRELLRGKMEQIMPHYPSLIAVSHLSPHYTMKGIILELLFEAGAQYSIEQIHSETEQLCAELMDNEADILEITTSLLLTQRRR